MQILAWPITVLIIFFGCLWYAVKRSQFKESLDTLKFELSALKSKQDVVDSDIESLKSDINNIKVSRGFSSRG